MLVQFRQWRCNIKKMKYGDGSPALVLEEHLNGEQIVVASVCMADFPVETPEGHTWIKTWSENEGVFEALVKANVVEDADVEFEVNQWGSMARLVKLLI